MIRVAIVGLGLQGIRHAEAFRAFPSRCRVVSGFDPAPVAASAAKDLGLAIAPSLEAALDAADLVVVATPATTHVELVALAIERGRHVLVEKPLALTAREGLPLVDAAAGRGVSLVVGFSERFNPVVRWLRANVDGAAIESLEIERSSRARSVSPSDILSELAVHDVDLVAHLTGDRVRDLHAVVERRGGFDVHAAWEIALDRGARARGTASFRAVSKRRLLGLRGTFGVLACDLLEGSVALPDRTLPVRGPAPLGEQARAVLELLEAGETNQPLVHGAEVRRVLEALARASIAAHELETSPVEAREVVAAAQCQKPSESP